MAAALKEGKGSEAQKLSGRALHTLQDFYSHSNWVELGRILPSTTLGRFGSSPYPRTPPDLRTCNDCSILLLPYVTREANNFATDQM